MKKNQFLLCLSTGLFLAAQLGACKPGRKVPKTSTGDTGVNDDTSSDTSSPGTRTPATPKWEDPALTSVGWDGATNILTFTMAYEHETLLTKGERPLTASDSPDVPVTLTFNKQINSNKALAVSLKPDSITVDPNNENKGTAHFTVNLPDLAVNNQADAEKDYKLTMIGATDVNSKNIQFTTPKAPAWEAVKAIAFDNKALTFTRKLVRTNAGYAATTRSTAGSITITFADTSTAVLNCSSQEVTKVVTSGLTDTVYYKLSVQRLSKLYDEAKLTGGNDPTEKASTVKTVEKTPIGPKVVVVSADRFKYVAANGKYPNVYNFESESDSSLSDNFCLLDIPTTKKTFDLLSIKKLKGHIEFTNGSTTSAVVSFGTYKNQTSALLPRFYHNMSLPITGPRVKKNKCGSIKSSEVKGTPVTLGETLFVEYIYLTGIYLNGTNEDTLIHLDDKIKVEDISPELYGCQIKVEA